MRTASIVGCFLVALSVPASAQMAGTILGVVRIAGDPAPGVHVGLRGTLAFSTITDSGGRFTLPQVPPGQYVVVATSGDAHVGTVAALVRGGDRVSVVILLGEPVQVSEIAVTATKASSYLADSATGGTKFPAPLMDIPQVISVVPQALIDDRHITESRALTRNVAGVVPTPPYTGTGLNETNFIFRGQPSSSGLTTLRDGFRDFGALMPLDMAGIDRVEFLMGPESVLYGSAGSVGGMANFVSKQPLARRAGSMTLSADQHGGVRSTLDVGGPLSSSGDFLYRLNAAGEQIRSYRDYSTGSYGFSVAPAITWLPSTRISVTLMGNYTQRQYPGDPYLPIYAGTFSLPVSRWYGEPHVPFSLAQGLISQLVVSYRLSAGVQLREGLGYSSVRLSDYNYELLGLDSLGTSVLRGYGHSDETAQDAASQTELLATFMIGGARNRAIAGLELSTQRHAGFNTRGDSLAPINLDHPAYGAVPSDTAGVDRWHGSVNQLGLYAQDLLDLGSRVKVVAGARFDLNRSAFTVHAPTDTFELQQTVDHVSPRLGVVYQPTPATSLYGSWATSFWPNQSCARCGDPKSFPPEEGKQIEIGIKQQFAQGRFGATLALYQLTKQNIMIGDPSDPTFMKVLIVGSMQSRGVELSASGSPAPGLGVVVTYAHTDARVAVGNETFPVGTVPANTPRNRLNLWTSYAVRHGALHGFEFGAGLTGADWQYANWGDRYRLPRYGLIDALLGYHGQVFGAQLNFTNLTDSRSYEGVMLTEVAPGAPRSVVLTISYQLMNP